MRAAMVARGLVQVGPGRAARTSMAAARGLLGWEVAEAVVDQRVGERLGVVERGLDGCGASGVEGVGGVGAGGPGGVSWVESVEGELPVGAFGGDLAGDVVVGGHDRRRMTHAGELGGLFAGEGGAEGCVPDVPAGAGEGDRDRVERAFDEYRNRLRRGVAGGSVQLGAFAVQQRVGGVEVLRPGVRVVVAVVGVAAGDEPENLGVVDDGQDEPVPEPVDDPPVPGPGDESGEFHLLVA